MYKHRIMVMLFSLVAGRTFSAVIPAEAGIQAD
jgi:hypothetical protein